MSSLSLTIEFTDLTDKSKNFLKSFFDRSLEQQETSAQNQYPLELALFEELGVDLYQVDFFFGKADKEKLVQWLNNNMGFANPWFHEKENKFYLGLEFGAFSEANEAFIPYIISAVTPKPAYVLEYNSSYGGYGFYVFENGNYTTLYTSEKDETLDKKIADELGEELDIDKMVAFYHNNKKQFKPLDTEAFGELYYEEKRNSAYILIFVAVIGIIGWLVYILFISGFSFWLVALVLFLVLMAWNAYRKIKFSKK